MIKYALAPKCQVCNWLCTRDLEFALVLLQSEIYQQDVQINDLQENLKTQQAETSKAKDELKTALTTMEQLKEWFKSEQANWDTEKARLLKRAEDTESALKSMTEELTGLKGQVNAMISAIFGKHYLPRLYEYFALKFLRFNMNFLNRYR